MILLLGIYLMTSKCICSKRQGPAHSFFPTVMSWEATQVSDDEILPNYAAPGEWTPCAFQEMQWDPYRHTLRSRWVWWKRDLIHSHKTCNNYVSKIGERKLSGFKTHLWVSKMQRGTRWGPWDKRLQRHSWNTAFDKNNEQITKTSSTIRKTITTTN